MASNPRYARVKCHPFPSSVGHASLASERRDRVQPVLCDPRRSSSACSAPSPSWPARLGASGCRRRSCWSSAGCSSGCCRGCPAVDLDPDLIFFIFLPPLIYGAGFNSSPRDLRAQARRIGVLAIGLVAASTVAVAVAVKLLVPGFGWPEGFVLGAILAPTDPVAAVAIMQRLRVDAAALGDHRGRVAGQRRHRPRALPAGGRRDRQRHASRCWTAPGSWWPRARAASRSASRSVG